MAFIIAMIQIVSTMLLVTRSKGRASISWCVAAAIRTVNVLFMGDTGPGAVSLLFSNIFVERFHNSG